MARGFVRLDAETTPDADTLADVLRRAQDIENNFAYKIAAALRGARL